MVRISDETLLFGKMWMSNSSKNQEVVLTLWKKIQYNVACVNLDALGKRKEKNMDYIKKMISMICKTKDNPETDTVKAKERNTFVKNAVTLTVCGLLVVSVASSVDAGVVETEASANVEETSNDDGSAPGRYLAELDAKAFQVQSELLNYELDKTIEHWVDTMMGSVQEEEVVTEETTEQLTASTQKNEEQIVAESEYVIEFTEEDYEVLCIIVEAEAGDQDDIGKILVANVILNRVRAGEFPDNIKDVVFQKSSKTYQFSPTRPGGRYYTVTPDESTIECVERALRGEDYSEGALYFAMKTSSGSWFNRCLEFLFKHGDHYFYK